MRKRGRRQPTFNLTTRKSESAGPYAVALHSTLVLRPGDNGSISSSSFGTTPGPRPVRTHVGLVERVVAAYRLSASSGVMVAGFQAAAGPLCQSLGDCGASGSVSLAGLTAGRVLVVSGSRIVRHRVGRARALADFRAKGFEGFGDVTVRANVTGLISGGESTTCSDRRSSPFDLQLSVGQGRTIVGLSDQTGDAVRTYCPGPLAADLIPTNGFYFAQGSFSNRQLGAPVMSASFEPPGRFPRSPYLGGWSGTLGLTFTRVRLQAGTIRARVP